MRRIAGLLFFVACWRGTPSAPPIEAVPRRGPCGSTPSDLRPSSWTPPSGPCVGLQATLVDGKVLEVGERCASLWTGGAWQSVAPPPRDVVPVTMTAIGSGAMLIGVVQDDSIVSHVQIFDAITRRWRSAAPLDAPRVAHSAIRLHDGHVLVAGGCNDMGEDACMNADGFVASYEIYDPGRDRWRSSPLRLDRVRYSAALVQLADGRVLALGGSIGDHLDPPPTLVWDGVTWCAARPLLGYRSSPHAELLADGESVLITGVVDNEGPVAEVYRLAKGCSCN